MTKRELREQRRAHRLAAEQAAAAADTRRRRLWRLGIAAGVAAILVATVAAVSSSNDAPPPTANAASIVAGIPESNGVLGDPKAPVTVTEYVDLAVPDLRRRPRRTTLPAPDQRLRQDRQGQAAGARRCASSARTRCAPRRSPPVRRQQGKLWAFLETFYASQGDRELRLRDRRLPARGRHRRRRRRGQGPELRRHAARAAARSTVPTATRSRGRRPTRPRRSRSSAATALRRSSPSASTDLQREARQGARVMTRAAAIVVAVVGLGIATYLTIVHYAGGEPVCAIAHGCATVQKSDYAQLAGRAGRAARRARLSSRSSPALIRDNETTRTAAAFLSIGGLGFSRLADLRRGRSSSTRSASGASARRSAWRCSRPSRQRGCSGRLRLRAFARADHERGPGEQQRERRDRRRRRRLPQRDRGDDRRQRHREQRRERHDRRADRAQHEVEERVPERAGRRRSAPRSATQSAAA